jgi:hypothetical protein
VAANVGVSILKPQNANFSIATEVPTHLHAYTVVIIFIIMKTRVFVAISQFVFWCKSTMCHILYSSGKKKIT